MRKILEAEDKLEPRISPLIEDFEAMLEEEENQSSAMEDSNSDLEAQYDLTLKLPRKKKNDTAVGDYVSSEEEKIKEKEVTNLGDLIKNYANDKEQMHERAAKKKKQLLAAADNEAMLNKIYNRKDTSEEERDLKEERKREREKKRKKKEQKKLEKERQKAEKTRRENRSDSPLEARLRENSPRENKRHDKREENRKESSHRRKHYDSEEEYS